VGRELEKQGICFIPADIGDPAQLDTVFSSADCVIHCAARAGDWGTYREFYEANVTGTQNIIHACKKNSIRKMIFVSTPSIYFTGRDRYDISEEDPIPSRQFSYGKTKLITEKILLDLKQEGFSVIIFRPRAVYGKYDTIIVPRILKMSEKKRFPLINQGEAMVDITYVDNFVNAVKLGLSAPEAAWNEVYNITNGNPISMKEWFSQVLEIFERPFHQKNVSEPVAKTFAGILEFLSLFPCGNSKPMMTRFSVGYMAKSMTLSIVKAKQKLGYLPEFSNQEGFVAYKKWKLGIKRSGNQ
jgi:nucleoside-diphosphate-sugar epimerase